MARQELQCVGGPLCGDTYEVELNDYRHELPFGGMHGYCIQYIKRNRGKWASLGRVQVLLYEPLVETMGRGRW